MAVFLGSLTGLAAIALAVWGLILLQRGRVESAVLVQSAGLLALVVGIGAAIGNGVVMVRDMSRSDLDHPYRAPGMDNPTGGYLPAVAPSQGGCMCAMCKGMQAPAAPSKDGKTASAMCKGMHSSAAPPKDGKTVPVEKSEHQH